MCYVSQQCPQAEIPDWDGVTHSCLDPDVVLSSVVHFQTQCVSCSFTPWQFCVFTSSIKDTNVKTTLQKSPAETGMDLHASPSWLVLVLLVNHAVWFCC